MERLELRESEIGNLTQDELLELSNLQDTFRIPHKRNPSK